MALKDRRKALLAKLEQSYGTDAAPTGAADAIQLRRLDLTPLGGDYVERNLLRPGLGNEPSLLTGRHARLECEVELAGAGTAGKAPAYDVLLRGCAMAAATDSSAKTVTYVPTSGAEPSLTLYWFLDGHRQKLTGARGDVTFSLSPGGVPSMRYSFTGQWSAVDAASLPRVDFSRFAMPLVPSKANTPTFTLGGSPVVPSDLELTLGNEIVHHDRPNSSETRRTGRAGTGRITLETPAPGGVDLFALADGGRIVDLVVEHGTAAGRVIRLTARCQLTNPSLSEDRGDSMTGLDLRLVPSANGDDELKLVVK